MKKYLITLLCLLLAVCCAHPALADDTFAFDKTVTELFEGETLQTVLIREGAYAEGEVTYTTSSPKVATVDANGVVTGLKKLGPVRQACRQRAHRARSARSRAGGRRPH